MKSHLIFIGAPGSGKGTQAAKLVSQKGLKQVSTGDLLRGEIAKGSELGKEVKAVMDAGNLVSDDLVVRLLLANINLATEQYIFDGYPRNLAQAQTLDKDVLQGVKATAVYFNIDLNKLVERLTNRRTCKDCGSIYNLISKKPKIEGVCDKCSSTNLVQRADDKEDVIRNRLEVFQQSVNPVLDYYKQSNRLVVLDADQGEEDIFSKISSIL
jgi:adenylate kinase